MTSETQKPDISSLRIRREHIASERGRALPWKIVLPVVVVVAAAAVYLLTGSSIGGAREVELTTATLTNPSQANAVLTASGYVVAQVKAAVASKGTGRLEFLGVEEGDRVKKNDIIARLEDNDMVAALEQARANLKVAQAELDDARLTLERTQTLHDRALASTADLDGAKARYQRVQASILAAEAAVRGAEVAVENTRIRAPFDGTVLTKDADVGEVVAPFASSASSRGAVVTMADMTSLQVEADVSESNIIRVEAGQPCEIILDAYPDKRYAGSVHKIVPTADRAKATVLTKVAFKERDQRVLPEMSAKVYFLAKDAKTTPVDATPKLTVPLSAVTTRDDVKLVLLAREGRVVEMPVVTGAILGDRVEIREGLAQGDQVVLRPDPTLTGGTAIKSATK
jgi:RND family efflux transporter MFP subunit